MPNRNSVQLQLQHCSEMRRHTMQPAPSTGEVRHPPGAINIERMQELFTEAGRRTERPNRWQALDRRTKLRKDWRARHRLPALHRAAACQVVRTHLHTANKLYFKEKVCGIGHAGMHAARRHEQGIFEARYA
jgi:hypothetical protein